MHPDWSFVFFTITLFILSIQTDILWSQILAFTVCLGLSVLILRVDTVTLSYDTVVDF